MKVLDHMEEYTPEKLEFQASFDSNHQFQVYKKDGIELVIDAKNGEAFATEAGYTRMSGKPKSTVASRVQKGVRSRTIKTAEIQLETGLHSVRLIPADIVYDWSFDDNPDLAKAMGKAGATIYLQQLAGFKVKSAPPEEDEKIDPLDTIMRRLDDLEDDARSGRQWKSFEESQKSVNPGLISLINGARDAKALNPVKTWYTASEWAQKKKISLNQQQKSVLCAQAAAIYKNFKGRNPHKDIHKESAYIYSSHEEFILIHALETTFKVVEPLIEEIQGLDPISLIDLCADAGVVVDPKNKLVISIIEGAINLAIRNEELPDYCRYSRKQYYAIEILKTFIKRMFGR